MWRHNKEMKASLLVLVVCVILTLLPAQSKAARIPVSFYSFCYHPRGLFYSTPGGSVYLPIKGVPVYNELMAGAGNYCAIQKEHHIIVYRGAICVRNISAYDASFVGWLPGKRLVYSVYNKTGLYSLNVKSGKVVKVSLPEDVLAVWPFRSGYFTIELHNVNGPLPTGGSKSETQVTLWDGAGKIRSAWHIHAGSFGDFELRDDRWLVVEVAAKVSISEKSKWRDYTTLLWIIDLKRKRQYTSKVGWFDCGFCPGEKYGELLIDLPASMTSTLLVKSTRIISLDLHTLRRKDLLVRKGELNIVGISTDRKWLIVLRPYTEVGPSALLAINLANGSTHMLQKQVYSCVLTSKGLLEGKFDP